MIYNGFMYKIIATDLDETLLNSQKHVSKQDIQSISELTDTKLVIATGRGFEAVQENLKEIGQYNKENQYLISFNGGVITENKENKILYAELMPFEDAKMLFEIGLKYDVCIHVYALDCCYAYRMFKSEKELLNAGSFNVSEFFNPDIEFLRNKKIAKVLFCKEDMPYLRNIKKEIDLDDKFAISFSSNRYLEINPKGINKGKGLLKLCEILNVDIKDTIGVGDNINDIELIQTAGLGIGVNNTLDEAKPICDVILNSTNNENPITEIIDRFIK